VLFADQQPIAFSYGTVAGDALPSDFSPRALQGSVFDYLEPLGLLPEYAEGALKPVHDLTVGWEPHRPASNLYLLLDQIQYLSGERPLSWSQIFFIEDRFQFTIVRRRR
jgi:GntR family transcriptional regulator